ncbi:ABC transporter substrate-binding protein [Lutimaribacter marinistellae]|uniref:ABC transporter substrate-binding protein n=1 Tax=Lutimaribacter marinistellae TaxID=1820329 RepID=A0ABV7TIC4_9RHOB
MRFTSVSVRGSRIITCLAALVFAGAALAQPQRVVSMNLCTDQLAMMLAAPGQLHSVTFLARDPGYSAMPEEAMAYEVNHRLAEEIYLQQPDLVISGSFSGHATVDMIRRLGIEVEVFDPARSLEDVRANILRMGELLGRQDAAEAMVARYDAGLAALQVSADENGPRAAIYALRGWTQGERSLAGQILRAAGFRNIAAELGYDWGGVLPLERLAMIDPDVVITARPSPGHGRAKETMDHPVIDYLRARAGQAVMSDRDWVCGTPHVLGAIERLAAIRGQVAR